MEIKRLNELDLPQDANSKQGIGYKEMYRYVNGECTLDEALDDIKKNTRHFAKRQLTWLRHEEDTIFINKSDYEHDDNRIIDFMMEEFKKL